MALRQTFCKHLVVLSKPPICVNETPKEAAALDVPTQSAASAGSDLESQQHSPEHQRQPLLQNYPGGTNKLYKRFCFHRRKGVWGLRRWVTPAVAAVCL